MDDRRAIWITETYFHPKPINASWSWSQLNDGRLCGRCHGGETRDASFGFPSVTCMLAPALAPLRLAIALLIFNNRLHVDEAKEVRGVVESFDMDLADYVRCNDVVARVDAL
jgi:hypothetical protein